MTIYRKEEVILMRYVCSRKYLTLYEYKGGYLLVNNRKKFEKGHSHISSKSLAISVMKNVLENKLPKTRSKQSLIAHLRVTSDKRYRRILLNLIDEIEMEEDNHDKNNRVQTDRDSDCYNVS